MHVFNGKRQGLLLQYFARFFKKYNDRSGSLFQVGRKRGFSITVKRSSRQFYVDNLGMRACSMRQPERMFKFKGVWGV